MSTSFEFWEHSYNVQWWWSDVSFPIVVSKATALDIWTCDVLLYTSTLVGRSLPASIRPAVLFDSNFLGDFHSFRLAVVRIWRTRWSIHVTAIRIARLEYPTVSFACECLTNSSVQLESTKPRCTRLGHLACLNMSVWSKCMLSRLNAVAKLLELITCTLMHITESSTIAGK